MLRLDAATARRPDRSWLVCAPPASSPSAPTTLAAFIGAGGLGEPIVTGLQLADTTLILSGALPAALLAVAVDFGLGRLERAVRPAGLEAS